MNKFLVVLAVALGGLSFGVNAEVNEKQIRAEVEHQCFIASESYVMFDGKVDLTNQLMGNAYRSVNKYLSDLPHSDLEAMEFDDRKKLIKRRCLADETIREEVEGRLRRADAVRKKYGL